MWLVVGIHLRGSPSTQPVGEHPPLLQSWKAQREELVCVEVFGTAGRLWVLTASTDGSVSMWTQGGDHVGCFGQRTLWNLSEPAAHHRSACCPKNEIATQY